MDALIAVVGTLLGGLLGAVGSHVTLKSAYQRESQERLGAVRRQAYVEFLTAVHDMFSEVGNSYRLHRRGELTAEQTKLRLGAVSTRQAQATLENLRLLATDSGAAAAANLWQHMRGHHVPLGALRLEDRWERRPLDDWREEYWQFRRDLVDAARKDMGFSGLDWRRAGVGPGRLPPPESLT